MLQAIHRNCWMWEASFCMRNWKNGLAVCQDGVVCSGRGRLRWQRQRAWLTCVSSQWQATSQHLTASFLKFCCELDPDIEGLKAAVLGSAGFHSGIENNNGEDWDGPSHLVAHLTKKKIGKQQIQKPWVSFMTVQWIVTGSSEPCLLGDPTAGDVSGWLREMVPPEKRDRKSWQTKQCPPKMAASFKLRFKGCRPSLIFPGEEELVTFPWELSLFLSSLSDTLTASSGDLLWSLPSDFLSSFFFNVGGCGAEGEGETEA